ncbi:MAG: SH3 domain-containing protein [Anaerolineales bacterium]
MKAIFLVAAGVLLASILLISSAASAAPVNLQATATPDGPRVIVPEQANVRLGPSLDYEKVGVLIAGQEAPALGRSPGGDWIQIFYAGVQGNVAWVYAPNVILEAGQRLLPIIEPPPTPTPRVTTTIDPTFAAQFNIGTLEATRLPTFTPADPVVMPTVASSDAANGGGFPPILAILGLLVLGLFGTVISFLRGS